MKIRLSHHYWQDRKNATWNPPQFPYPGIELEIKQAYPLLEVERPRYKVFGDITVFFDYRPAKDAYGRDIIPISFAFVEGCADPLLCAGAVLPALARMPESALEMDVDLPAGCLRAESRKLLVPALVGLGIAAALVGAWLLFAGKEETAQAPPPPPSVVESRETERAAAEKESQEPPAESAPAPAESEEFGVCDSEALPAKLWPCPRAFLEAYCAGTLGKGQTFNKFRAAHKEECGSWNNSGMDNIGENELTREERRLLRPVFK